MAIYEPSGSSLWQLVGIAARTAIAIDLHRRDDVYFARHPDVGSDETTRTLMNKRRIDIFWSLYNTDREMVYMLGRPAAIRDEDIDVDVSSSVSVSDA